MDWVSRGTARWRVDTCLGLLLASALALGSGQISQVNVPQDLLGASGDYHMRSGFDGGLRFDYGSYKDYLRPDLNGKLRSYSVFFGRTW